MALSVWPNPVTDVLNVAVDITSPTATVTILDVQGRVVRTSGKALVKGSTILVPVSELADGLYAVRVGNGLNAVHQRFVKSH